MTAAEALEWIIQKRGTARAAARELDVLPSVLSNWRARGVSAPGTIAIWFEANRLGAKLPKEFLLQAIA